MKKTKYTPVKAKNKPGLGWYVMYGYNKDNQDQVGYLSFSSQAGHTYNIVPDLAQAKRFPSKDKKNKDFGTPEQWLDFFDNDPELDDWSFHLVKVKK